MRDEDGFGRIGLAPAPARTGDRVRQPFSPPHRARRPPSFPTPTRLRPLHPPPTLGNAPETPATASAASTAAVSSTPSASAGTQAPTAAAAGDDVQRLVEALSGLKAWLSGAGFTSPGAFATPDRLAAEHDAIDRIAATLQQRLATASSDTAPAADPTHAPEPPVAAWLADLPPDATRRLVSALEIAIDEAESIACFGLALGAPCELPETSGITAELQRLARLLALCRGPG